MEWINDELLPLQKKVDFHHTVAQTQETFSLCHIGDPVLNKACYLEQSDISWMWIQ